MTRGTRDPAACWDESLQTHIADEIIIIIIIIIIIYFMPQPISWINTMVSLQYK